MRIAVRELRADETDSLEAALERLPSLPFTRGYRLPREGSVRNIVATFKAATGGGDRSRALIAVSDGEIAGGLVLADAAWEGSIFGLSMARVPFVFTAPPGGGLDGARAIATELLATVHELISEMGTQHCSVLVQTEGTGIIHALCEDRWRLVDSTVDFTWVCGETNPGKVDPRFTLRPSAEADREPLARLACESYTRAIRTRFSSDPWLPIAKTGELYARWFELACEGEFGDVVVVAEIDGRPVGFNTFKLDRQLSQATGVGFAGHGIAAVEAEFRGLAGQPAMLHWLTEWQRERGGRFNHGRVLTNNYPMQRACLKSGAFVTQAYHTFHRWFGSPPAAEAGEHDET